MKTFGLCGGIGALAFILSGIQVGLFQEAPQQPEEPAPAEVKAEEKTPVKKAHFPRDLAPAARAEPVSQAAAYDPEARMHRMVILKTNGVLYESWQERLREGWQAEAVEETSLAVIVGPQKKTFLEKIPYPNGAPPISRYKYELEASVIEAKTGKVLANRKFVNVARGILRVETWDTTALGSPVEFRTVFNWVASAARTGFPYDENPSPVVNIVN